MSPSAPQSIFASVRNAAFGRLKQHPVMYARTRALFSRPSLPPGDLVEHDRLGTADRTALLQRAQTLGPIFKCIAWQELQVCVVGLDHCRDLLKQHQNSLARVTMQLDHLIPKGLLHAMEGRDHRHYRRATNRAILASGRSGHRSLLGSLIDDSLDDFARRSKEHNNSAAAYTHSMFVLATSVVTWLFFGARPGTPAHERFLGYFFQLGPHGLVWNPRQRQAEAYRAFVEDLQSEIAALRSGHGKLDENALLGQMLRQGTLDETLLGNLVYQAEMGRSDLKNWFRWLTRHVADDPGVLERIRAEEDGHTGERTLAESFALETLRTDQSERMMRRVTKDFVHAGFLFPVHATLRLCLWESHHLDHKFVQPHEFDPTRFVDEIPGRETYAPFGLGHHRCPMGGVVIELGVAFLRVLAHRFRIEKITQGHEVRGGYHWEPAPDFAVKLEHR